MRYYHLIFSILTFTTIGVSQDSLTGMLKDFSFYSDVMVNAQAPEHRILAQAKAEEAFQSIIDAPNSFDIPLADNKWVITAYPSDSTFRIISWQYELEDRVFENKTVIQNSDHSYHVLNSDADLSPDLAFEALDSEYGIDYLAYEINDFEDVNGNTLYMIFGYKQLSQYDKVKLVDVMSFDDAGKPIFDHAVFVENPDTRRPLKRNRIYLQYSADATVKLNYNPNLGLIIFDNLIPRMGMIPGQGTTNLPDGSYSAYEFKSGEWIYVEKLYNQISEEAPMPAPISTSKTKSITGGKKRTKN